MHRHERIGVVVRELGDRGRIVAGEWGKSEPKDSSTCASGESLPLRCMSVSSTYRLPSAPPVPLVPRFGLSSRTRPAAGRWVAVGSQPREGYARTMRSWL